MTDSVITTAGLTRYYRKRRVVDSVTMTVPRGGVFAFLGRNGSGKTTTIRMLLGLLDPTRGSSRVLGYDSRSLTPEAIARIGYMSESHTLYDWMTVRQCGDYQARFYMKWNPRIFDSVVGHFKLDPKAKAGHLSRGERAGLSLAITLAPEPELLILDDPALGLDPVARRSLIESMIYVTRGADRTIFFSSHLLDDVERVADSLAILDRGVLRACCSVDTFRDRVIKLVATWPSQVSEPRDLPRIPGVVRVMRHPGGLSLIVAGDRDEVRRALASLGAVTVEEAPVSLDDALVGYLADRGEQGFFLSDVAEPGNREKVGGAA